VEFLRDQFGHRLLANNIHELRLAHETNNMLLNAEMRLKAGTSYRERYPYTRYLGEEEFLKKKGIT